MPRLFRRILVLVGAGSLALVAVTWAQAVWMYQGLCPPRWPVARRFFFLLWPDLGLRVALFALLLYLLWVCLRTIRRMVLCNRAAARLKRRRCTACAYPIGGSDVCTECGSVPEVMPRDDVKSLIA